MKRRAAFTLIEMLVAIGIVVLMMTMFASIFQLATNTMFTQRGLSENDQRVRLVMTMLRNDLGSTDIDPVTGNKIKAHRTFKCLIPWGAQEAPGPDLAPINPFIPGYLSNASPADREGYFYLSEGNPNDDTDDNLQFTITVNPSASDRIYGRAAILLADGSGYGPPGTTPPPAGYPPNAPAAAPFVPPPANGHYWQNQPEFDDLQGTTNQVASSTTAEVSYFLRNGTLYRRVMLVRKPNVATGNDHDPQNDSAGNLFWTPYTSGKRNFYSDFDYSAVYNSLVAEPVLHGLTDLSGVGGASSPLLHPANRWGFDNTSAFGSGRGLPKEWIGLNYIGRYTHAETSDATFGYPAMITGASGDPMASNNAALNFANGSVTNFPNGTRAGEDVIMTNVISFDIKVWDPAASLGPDNFPGIVNVDDDGANGIDDNGEIGAFGSDDGDWRDLGHPGLIRGVNTYGFFRAPTAATNPNPYYSNVLASPMTNRFDTWGGQLEFDGTPAVFDNPPYRPLYLGPDKKPGKALFDDDGDGIIDNASEIGAPGTDDFAPLTAIKINIRFYDVTSKQIRDVTSVFSLAQAP